MSKCISVRSPSSRGLSHQEGIAEVLGLTDTPTGVKARLKFADGSRDLVSTTQSRMLQDKDLEKLGVGKLARKLWGS